MERTDFGQVVKALKAGRTVTRVAWTNPHRWLSLLPPDALFTRPTPILLTDTGDRIPWTPLPEDLFAEDWVTG